MDPLLYYTIGGLFAVVVFAVIMVIAIKGFQSRNRNRSHRTHPLFSFTRQSRNSASHSEHSTSTYDLDDGQGACLYSAKPVYEHDPSLLPLSGKSDDLNGHEDKNLENPSKNGISYLVRLPGDNLAIVLEKEFYERYPKS